MESMQTGLSRWFYLGVFGLLIGVVLIYLARGQNKSKTMENGYFIFILGLVGIISEWTDFATVLFVFVVISGLILLVNKVILSRVKNENVVTPHYVYYAKEFFPIVLAVWVLRAFLFEAYQIPSSSMRPDLTVGDFILVNKFTYGLREPLTNRVLIPVGSVKRGDVVVFKDPNVRNRDLIKRVIGVGGDKIEYNNKRLTINGQALTYLANGEYSYSEEIAKNKQIDFEDQKYQEDLFGVKHNVITWDQVPSLFYSQVIKANVSNNCTYNGDDGFTCVVPQGQYFMMGDNRDNSFDSRYWGFVPERDILGKAILVWMNFHDLSRVGTKI